MVSLWDARYSAEEYIYGKEPNVFLKEFLNNISIKGIALFPAEGEGRNAVYAATQGWDVFAYDQSEVAKQKAEKLATELNVNIKYRIEDLSSYHPAENFFDLITLIYVHIPSIDKENFFKTMLLSLKKGGTLLMEVFSKDQLSFNSGGPKDTDMLYSTEELQGYFSETDVIEIKKEEILLNEGILHKGKGSVIRVIVKKK